MYNYEQELQNLKNAQIESKKAALENTRNQALSNLNAEQQQNTIGYENQRKTANAQNRLGARNFQEYLASTGRANSGLASQARLQNQNNLSTNLNNINSAELASNADIARRRTEAQNDYNSGLAQATSQAEADYIERLIQLRKELANYYSNFSSGGRSSRSSGGSSSESTTDDDYVIDTSSNNNSNNKTVDKQVAVSSKESKALSKLKWDGKSIGTINARDGKASVQLYKYNGHYYYKTNKGWSLYS